MKVILQKINTAEVRAISQYAAICNGVEVIYTDYDNLIGRVDELEAGAMPVGSVEFVSRAMQLIGINPPRFNPYPDGFYYGREIKKCHAYELLLRNKDTFIKPVELKLFNGFVFRGMDAYYCHHDAEQLEKFTELPLYEEIYLSNVVNFVAEWRCYYLNGELIGVCRYDDNEEEFIVVDDFVSSLSLQKYVNNETIAVDIGLLDNGKFCVVECNDAWAIGKYKGISNKHYFEFLSARWDEIMGVKNEK